MTRPSKILAQPLANSPENPAGGQPRRMRRFGAFRHREQQQARSGRKRRAVRRFGKPLDACRPADPNLLVEDEPGQLAHAMQLAGAAGQYHAAAGDLVVAARLEADLEELDVKVTLPERNHLVQVDPAELQEVLINLLSNSLYWLRQVPKGRRAIVVQCERPQPGEVDLWVFGGTDVGGTTGSAVPHISPDSVRAHNATITGGPPPGGTPTTQVPVPTETASTTPTLARWRTSAGAWESRGNAFARSRSRH